MIEPRANVAGDLIDLHHLRPVKQQIVIIEHVLLLLGLDIGAEERLELFFPTDTPGKIVAEDLIKRGFGVDSTRIDRKTGVLGRKTFFGFRKAEIVPKEVQQVGGIFPIMDGESAVEPDLLGIFAQKPCADGVERPGPAQRICGDPGLVWKNLSRDVLDPADHLDCCPTGKGQEHDPSRIGAQHDEMRHAMGQRVGLAGAGTGDDEERRGAAMIDGLALFWVKPDEVRRCSHADEGESSIPPASTPFELSANFSSEAGEICALGTLRGNSGH